MAMAKADAKSGAIAVPQSIWKDRVYSCTKYVAQTTEAASLACGHEKPPALIRCTPRTEATSSAVNGNGGRKKRSYCRARRIIQFRRQRTAVRRYVARTAGAAALAGARSRLNECGAFPRTKRHLPRLMTKADAKSGMFTVPQNN